MKKVWGALFVIGFLLMGMGLACAEPEPVRQLEMIRKPGIDFRQFKSVGNDISVKIRPDSDWAIDKRESFLKEKIQKLTLKAAKNQGWIPADNEYADVRLTVMITEWGRLRNTADQNLMEYATFEIKAHSSISNESTLVFRGLGKYRRIDPGESDLAKVPEAFASMMEEMMAGLHLN